MLETGKRIGVLDGWRGLSIALVLVGHFFEGLIPKISFATLGVELFFVLSGRLMADILFIKKAPLLEFYRRRISRILPALAVFLVLVYFATLYTPISFKPIAAVSSLLFFFNYAFLYVGHHVLAIDQTWSLCIEEHTYILLGLLALALRKWHWPVRPVLACAAALSLLDGLISTGLGQGYFTVFWRTDAHISSILLGCLAYMACLDLKARGVAIPSVIVPFALAIAIGIRFLHPWFGETLYLSVGTAALAVAIANLEHAPRWLQTMFGWTVMRRLGVLSFSVYLWQQPLYRLAVGQTSLLAKGGLLLAAIGLGAVSYRFVEQPARRWLNSLQISGARKIGHFDPDLIKDYPAADIGKR